ncbi:MAG: relaxase domain-containing protein [Acidocella sp.]|nr:relaxase domain-containing protein [Acidocella sp.]
MVCTISAGTAASYYISEQSRYYTGGQEPVGRWFAPSATAGAGVVDGAEIDDATFERLHAGLDAAGHKLAQNADGSHADRVAGYDLTFSAPKSVSVVWGLGETEQRQAIEAAHDAAVRAALGVVNESAAFSRRGKGGAMLEAVQLTGAIFQHGEARPTEREGGETGGKTLEADPQLHSHAVIFNWAQRADGSCGSLDGRQLFRWKMAAGAVYRVELAARLQELGYGIERTDEKGLFEIVGMTKSVREAFSGRRQGIVAALRERGLATAEAPALAASVTKAGRKSKSAAPGADRHEDWRARAVELGFEVPLPGMKAAKPERSTASPADILARLTETKAVFRRPDIVAAVAADLVGTAVAGSEMEAVIAGRVQAVLDDAGLVPLDPDALGQPAYSTKEMVALEQRLAQTARELSGGYFGPVPSARGAMNGAGMAALSEEQRAAYDHACGTGRLALVEGAAGSGKTTTLSVIAQAYQQAGYEVIGSAIAWRAAQQLGEECGFESRALDSWLAKQRDGQEVFTRKTVLIVDEAGLLSTRQMHAVLTAAQAGGSKVILAGDQRQLQAIGAGSGLAIVAEQVNAARVDTNRRQKEAWARTAVSQLARGEAEPALRAFDEHGCLHWAGGQKAVINRALQLWRGHRQNHPGQSVVVLAKSNADVRALNAAMRAELRQSGQVRGDDVIVRAVDRSGGTYDLAVAKGDRLEITTRNKDLGVVNGTTGIVTRVEAGQNGQARLTLAIGSEAVTFSTAELADAKGRARLGHAYATTIYNAQGLTVDRAIVIGSSGLSANQAYVAASRARERTDIVIDSKEIDRELRTQARAMGSALPAPPTPTDRLSRLANGWARVEIKERATLLESRVPEMQRDVELEA